MGSTIALAEAAGIESSYLPPGWEIKVVSGNEDPDGPAPAAQLIASDAKTGEVTAIVGVTGIVDHVNDLIEPGAYKDTLVKRRPKVCWAHAWETPIGKVLRIEEWAPGDPRFAKVGATLDGKAWPAEAGALVAQMRLNLKSERGREAFAAVEFYSETGECEWSIGWQPVPTSTKKRADGVRVCKKVELFEVSPVLFGAAPLTRTLEVKALNLHAATRRGVQPRVGRPAGDPTQAQTAQAPPGQPGQPGQPPAPAVAPDQPVDNMNTAAATPGAADPTDAATLHRLAMPEIDWAEVDAAANPGGAPAPGTPAAAADPHAQPAGDPNAAADPNAETPAEDTGEGGTEEPADAQETDKNGKPLPPWMKKKKPGAAPAAQKKDGAVLLDPAALAAFTSELEITALTGVVLPEIKAQGGLDQNRGNAENLRRWYTHGGGALEIAWGTPGDFDRCVSIAGQHMDPERAKGYCNLRHHDAMGVWPAQHAAMENAATHAGKSLGVQAAELLAKSWNPLLEVGDLAAHGEQKFLAEGVDGLAGSFESRQCKLRDALEPVLKDKIGWKKPEPPDGGDSMRAMESDNCYVSIEGTWPDKVVATIVRYGEERTKQTFLVPYTFDGEDVTLGEPKPVELQVSIVPADTDKIDPDDDGDDDSGDPFDLGDDDLSDAIVLPAISLLGDGIRAMKGAMARSPEVKFGRVMSDANMQRFRAALEHLLEVARAAGIDLPGWTGKQPNPADDGELPETTAPTGGITAPAGTGGTAVKVLTPAQLAADLEALTNFS